MNKMRKVNNNDKGIPFDTFFTDCDSSISNCIECALNGENVVCSECSDTYFPSELEGIAAAQCARKYTYNNSSFKVQYQSTPRCE